MHETIDHQDERPLRRDAELNRAKIVAAAAEVIAELGLDAGYDEIARRAGVGVGTVYRRYPERDRLVEALFEKRLTQLVALADESLEKADPWDGLCYFLEHSLVMQIADRGLKEVLFASSSTIVGPLATARERLTEPIGSVLERAQRAGVVRDDIGVGDLGLLTGMLSSVGPNGDAETWRRYLQIVLDGLTVQRTGPTALLGAAPDVDAVAGALRVGAPRR